MEGFDPRIVGVGDVRSTICAVNQNEQVFIENKRQRINSLLQIWCRYGLSAVACSGSDLIEKNGARWEKTPNSRNRPSQVKFCFCDFSMTLFWSLDL